MLGAKQAQARRPTVLSGLYWGASLDPCLANSARPSECSAFWSSGSRHATLRGRWELVRDLDGKRLKALRVTSIEEVRAEDRPKLTPIDRALGVTETRLFSTTITLDERTFELTGFVGRIAGDWRVLSVLLSP